MAGVVPSMAGVVPSMVGVVPSMLGVVPSMVGGGGCLGGSRDNMPPDFRDRWLVDIEYRLENGSATEVGVIFQRGADIGSTWHCLKQGAWQEIVERKVGA